MQALSKFILGTMAAAVVALAVPSAKSAPIISEFMASNNTTIADQDGDFADWLEIRNPDQSPINLGGWYLTDKATKLTKWQIPSITLPSGGFLVIFCSSKNYTDPTQPLATNFNLSATSGYVALVEPDGKTVMSAYSYGLQYPDISYGVTEPTNASEAPQVGYFTVSTPGAANGNYTNILLSGRVSFSVPPGIFRRQHDRRPGRCHRHSTHPLRPGGAPSAAGDAVAAHRRPPRRFIPGRS